MLKKFWAEEEFYNDDFAFTKNTDFNRALDRVFMGYEEAIMLVVPRYTNMYYVTREMSSGNSELIYLSKDMIKVKRSVYKHTKAGHPYPCHEQVYCIRFFPTLDLCRYTQHYPVKKYPTKHWANISYSRASWQTVTSHISDIVDRYLKYYSYKHMTDNIYLNIVPMAGEFGVIAQDEYFKRAWRQSTFRGVLKAAGLPITRGMIRILASKILLAQGQPGDKYYKFNDLPLLAQAKTVWCITKDLDLTRKALNNNDIIDNYNTHIHYIGHTNAINKILVQKNTRRARNIANEIMDGEAWRLKDTMDMYKTVKNEYGVEPVLNSTKLSDIHNELTRLSEKIKNEQWEKELEYEDNLKELDGLEFCIINNKKHYKLILPKKANDLLDWGHYKVLNHCIGGASYRKDLSNGRYSMIGVTDEKDKMLYAITIINSKRDIIQFKGWSNCYPLAVEYDVMCTIMDQSGVYSLKNSQHDEDPRKWGRLKKRCDILGIKYEGGDEETPLVPAENRFQEIVEGADLANDEALPALDNEVPF